MHNATVMAFDFGLKRIGVAVGDIALKIPHALKTIDQAENVKRFTAITLVIKEWQPAVFVVGYPKHMDGGEHALAHLARKFGRRLEQEFHVKTEYIDETLSSCAAESILKEMGVNSVKRKQLLDSVAAQEILRSYFSLLPHAPTGY